MDSPEPEGSLQFDQAEYSVPTPVEILCKRCGNAIVDQYYDVNSQVLCSTCRAQFERKRTASERIWRFTKATVRGSLAAFAGFMLYFVVMKVTGWQIGLISIMVGFMVGNAVLQGSERTGGWLYQLLAVFLTYTAICASYMSVAMTMMPERGDIDANQAAPEKPGPAGAPKNQAVADKAPLPAGEFAMRLAIFGVYMLAFAYKLPILVGLSSPIGLLIVAFALWEAWKLNRRVVYVIQGPFALAPQPAAAIEVIPEDKADDDD